MEQAVPIEPKPPHMPQRLGFMRGKAKIPDDFDTMYADKIARMFNGEDSRVSLLLNALLKSTTP